MEADEIRLERAVEEDCDGRGLHAVLTLLEGVKGKITVRWMGRAHGGQRPLSRAVQPQGEGPLTGHVETMSLSFIMEDPYAPLRGDPAVSYRRTQGWHQQLPGGGLCGPIEGEKRALAQVLMEEIQKLKSELQAK